MHQRNAGKCIGKGKDKQCKQKEQFNLAQLYLSCNSTFSGQLWHNHGASSRLGSAVCSSTHPHLETARQKHPQKKKRFAHQAIVYNKIFLHGECILLVASYISVSIAYSRKLWSAFRPNTADNGFCLASLKMSHQIHQLKHRVLLHARHSSTSQGSGLAIYLPMPTGQEARAEPGSCWQKVLCRLFNIFVLVSPPLQWGYSSLFHLMLAPTPTCKML